MVQPDTHRVFLRCFKRSRTKAANQLPAQRRPFVTDPAEAKAYADVSPTSSIGGAIYAAVQASGGAITDSVDDFYFGDQHSTEWEQNIQDVGVFYWTLMFKLSLHQNLLDATRPAQ